MTPSFEEFDETAWDHGQELFEKWKKRLYGGNVYQEIIEKVAAHRMGGDPIQLCSPQKGAFNVQYRLRYATGSDAMIRFPIPAHFDYAREKLLAEVAVMRHVSDHTTVPLPFILHHGMKSESPGELGPFIIMEWVENAGDVVDVLNTPGLSYQDPPALNPSIVEDKLRHMYGQMADILLQLCQKGFNAIGSLGFPSDEDDPTVMTRPLSMNLAQLANLARVPLSFLPPATRTFSTSSDYYKVLADLHLSQLCFQRNQAIDSADDCRKKYVARQLFRKLAAENRLADSKYDAGPFKLWCDDFRPANVLVDKNDTVAAVIDWEFTYSAPAEFSHSPPWWLLLKAPEDWEAGLDDWAANYEPRLDTFLRALEARERELIEKRLLTERGIISRRMRENWESGRFWVTYAAQRTWAFDGIFWKYLDERFFGPNETGDWRSRMELLAKDQVEVMEEFVERKLREKDEGTLVDWDELDATSRLPPDIQRAYLSN